MKNIFEIRPLVEDWKTAVVLSLLLYAVAFAIRYQDAPKWNHPALFVDIPAVYDEQPSKERILGTHDAYFWMAGAKQVGRAQDSPMAILLDASSRIFNVKTADLAFWSPAFLCSLVSVVCFFWGRILAGNDAGIFAGLVGAVLPGYFLRTRLGYYDTDVVTLLFPLLVGGGLAFWLQPKVRFPWINYSTDEKDEAMGLGLPLILGFASAFGGWWHSSIGLYNSVALWTALGLVLLFGWPEKRAKTLLGLTLFLAAGFMGWVGAIGALGAYVVVQRRPLWCAPLVERLWPNLILLLGLMLISGVVWGPIQDIFVRVVAYLKPGSEAANADAGYTLVFPGITQSVMEAQNLPLSETLIQFFPWPLLTGLAFLSFLAVLVIRPVVVFLLPFLVMGILAVKLGNRFTMFGSPVAALGLGVMLHFGLRWVLPDMPWRRYAAWGAQAILAGLALSPLFIDYTRLPPTPVLTRTHAQALSQLAIFSPPNSQVWTWWDWGYATQYYAERMSFADGGRHSGPRLYLPALALASSSPMQAAQIIKYCAAKGYHPVADWYDKPPQDIQAFVDGLSGNRLQFPRVPKQYLVVTWENFQLMHWISYYGTWDFTTQTGTHAKSYLIDQQMDVDMDNGLLRLGKDQPIPLASVDVMGQGGVKHQAFSKPGMHVVYHEGRQQGFLMDTLCYQSMAVQLLIGNYSDPKLAEYFHLVWDGYPEVRIYEVK